MVLTRIPRGLALGLHAVLAVMTAIYAWMSSATDGPVAVGAWLVTASFVAVWGAVTWVTLPARSRLDPDADTAPGSRPLAALLSGAVVLVIAAAVVWGYVFLTDPGSLPNPGFVLILLLGAIGALPTLVRAATGRLHLWRLETTATGVRYRGGRTARELPWVAVGTVELNEPHTRLLITPAEDGGPAVAVPTLAFDVPPEELHQLVSAARARHR